jgi:hypothetical protein
MNIHDELKFRQGWTLEQKIDHSVGVVSAFLAKTNGKEYIIYISSFFSDKMYSTIQTVPILGFRYKNRMQKIRYWKHEHNFFYILIHCITIN